jgi:hypothetical protein
MTSADRSSDRTLVMELIDFISRCHHGVAIHAQQGTPSSLLQQLELHNKATFIEEEFSCVNVIA